MKYCFNPYCRKPLKKFFSVNRKCEICRQIYCKECFTKKENSFTLLNCKGYCFNCILSKYPEKNTNSEIPGSNLPCQERHQKEIIQTIRIINESPSVRYKTISQLGIGEFAQVFLVHDSDDKPFALKVLKNNQPDKMPVLEEVSPCYNSTCKNLVKIHEVFCFDSKYSILMEYMDFTLTQIFQRVKTYDKNLIGYIIREIVKGVKLLHSYGIIHRDLKPDNIFVNKLGQVKIGDLGNCAQLTRERELRDTFAGSPYWTAPEIILSQKYGKACDIWSIGMIFFEMLEGKLFFEKCRNIQQLINAMKSQTFTSFAREHSEDSIEFFQSCANYQPILRKAADELLDLSIFSNIDERKAKQQLLGK